MHQRISLLSSQIFFNTNQVVQSVNRDAYCVCITLAKHLKHSIHQALDDLDVVVGVVYFDFNFPHVLVHGLQGLILVHELRVFCNKEITQGFKDIFML